MSHITITTRLEEAALRCGYCAKELRAAAAILREQKTEIARLRAVVRREHAPIGDAERCSCVDCSE